MPKISGIKIYPDYRGKNIFQKLKNKAFKKILNFNNFWILKFEV